MDFDYNQKTKDYLARLTAFMDEHLYPNEHLYHRADRERRPLADPADHRGS